MQIDNLQTDKTEIFMALRPLLYSVAYQMLANAADAEDIVQECFLRWQKAETSKVRSPKAFLTTIVTRLCLKYLQSARVRREEYFGSTVPDFLQEESAIDPADHARLADSLSVALLVLLRALSPVERAVFLLREVFDCDYSEISRMIDKSEENCRQILGRARERVAARQPRYEVMPQQEERMVQRFLQATASGDWQALNEILSEDAVLVCDAPNLNQPGPALISGIRSVADSILQKARTWLGQEALLKTICLQGRPVILAYRDGIPISSIFMSLEAGRIKTVCVITCPVRLRVLLVQRGLAG